MVIVIGAGGGALGGPFRALQGAVEGLATNDELRRKDREEARQDKFDIQREADMAQAREMRAKQMELDKAQEGRAIKQEERQQEAFDWEKRQRQLEEDRRVAAQQSSAATLRGLTGSDDYDPDVGPVAPGYNASAKSPFSPGTQRALRELEARAPTMDPEEVRRQLDQVMQMERVALDTRSRARVKNILSRLSTGSVGADGAEKPPMFDESMIAKYEHIIDGDPENGIPPADPRTLDQVEASIYDAVKEASHAKAMQKMTARSVMRLNKYAEGLEALRDQAGEFGADLIDPDAQAEFDAITNQIEELGPTLTPSALASLESRAMSALKRKPSTSTRKAEKPRSEWDAHDWYDRDVQNAKDLGYTGRDAELYVQKAQQARAARPQAGAPAPVPVAPQDPVASEASKIDPFSKQGTPEERVDAAEVMIDQARMAGDKMSEDDVFAILEAAYDGRPMPDRKSTSRGAPTTRGQAMGVVEGGKRADKLSEAEKSLERARARARARGEEPDF